MGEGGTVQQRPAEVFGARVDSPVGELTVAVRDLGVLWVGRDVVHAEASGRPPRAFDDAIGRHLGGYTWVWEDVPVKAAPVADALRRYFVGDPDAFKGLPVAPTGTAFQMRVWEACESIPFGRTLSYGELAVMAGKPGAARAVGGAMNRNPIPFIVPCHRVVGADGNLVGYGMGGTGVKADLLAMERKVVEREQ